MVSNKNFASAEVTRSDRTLHVVSKRGQCRIIAGKWRGRVLRFDDAEGLRPTTDRIRETVFNWLQAYLPHSHCLDCFAGSGVLGFEALSRGADKVVFIEQNKQTINNLKENASVLAIDDHKMVIKHQDALSWLRSVQPMRYGWITAESMHVPYAPTSSGCTPRTPRVQ